MMCFFKLFLVIFLYFCALKLIIGTMKEMQFSAVLLMTLMALALVFFLPRRVSENRVANRSRWLMTGGLMLIGVQFLIQYISGSRATSMEQAVMINLVFFIPAAALMSLNILNLERQGRISRFEWLAGISTWLIALAILSYGIVGGEGSRRLLYSEILASFAYSVMQIYYSWLHLREVSRMELVLADYYDQDRSGLLRWMKFTIVIMSFTTVLVPLIIFSGGWFLACFAISLFVGIFYMWFCFVRYVITGASQHVEEAEQFAEQEEEDVNDNTMDKVDETVAKWIEDGSYLKSGVTKPMAAAEMQLPLYMLSAWIRNKGYSSYSRWITELRVEEAKRTIKQHPEWSVEAVADHCGISRSHFQRVFHDITGETPAQYSKN